MIKDKSFYKSFLLLTLSLALQNLLTYSVNLADNLMLGNYGEMALSGVSLCNQLQFFLQMLVVGAGEGVVVLGAQYWGKKKLKPIPNIIGVALRFGIAISATLFVLVLLFPTQILGLLANDTAVIAEGIKYLKIICFSYIIFTATNILVTSLRSIGIVKIGYIISASTLLINVCLNYCLIWGKFIFPELGIRGAAIATLIARCVELLIVIFYLKYKENTFNLSVRKLVRIDNSYIRDYVKVSSPVLLNQALWGIAQMVQTAVLGHMGATAIAANSIATVVFQVLSVLCYGAASASGIVVGRRIGAGITKDSLKQLVRTLEVTFLILGVFSGLAIFIARKPILSFYNISEEARALAMQFMAILSIATVGTAYQMAVDSGIIRGGGDTSFSAKLNIISMWCIVIPFSMLAAFKFGAAPIVVFFLLKWDQLYKVIPVKIRLESWNWLKRVTRDTAEI